ncbi:MAG: Unknown protein [uncultured Aureispira sp.]|uniref:Uncharacterized protein n=1 Tax=uncultured Aureispira sp. TaxID=1331704 RepID=A0A6S6TM11_9BACT|nr:MAG: Unknown protein [uncultured Aureispira sp.]
MIKSKLIQLYTCLDRTELEAFHKWLKSPLHNSDNDLSKLFIYIGSRRVLSKTSLDKNRVFKQLFPTETYQDLKLRRLMSKGIKHLENFVHFWMSKKNTLEQQKNVATFLRTRNRPLLAQQQWAKGKKALALQVDKTHAYYYKKYQLEQEHFEQAASQSRMRATNLQAIVNSFSIAFVIETLRYACTAISHKNLYATNYNIPLLDEILDLAKQSPYLDIAAIQLYYQAYMALTIPKDSIHFELLKRNLLKQEGLLPTKERKDLYTLAINYCIRRINSDESQKFIREVFELYKQGLKNKALLDNGILSRFTYKNIASAGLRLHEYDWIANYISSYAVYVEADYRESYQHYNTSKLYFAKEDYDQAMQRLIQVEYDDLFLNLDAKTMLMKIYYETQSYDALDAFFHSFTIYLQRKEIMGYHRENYLNIIRLTKKLLELPPRNPKAQQQLQDNIDSMQPLTERAWLLEQLRKI